MAELLIAEKGVAKLYRVDEPPKAGWVNYRLTAEHEDGETTNARLGYSVVERRMALGRAWRWLSANETTLAQWALATIESDQGSQKEQDDGRW